MEKIFSTSDVHPRDRFDYWHQVACRHIIKHDSRPECRARFGAALEAGRLMSIGFIRLQTSAMKVVHTQSQITGAAGRELFLCQQISGESAIEQNNSAVLKAGDMTLLDPLQPYISQLSEGCNRLIVRIPRRELEARVGQTRDMLLRCVRPLDPAAGLTFSYLASIAEHTERFDEATQALVKEQALDLLSVALTKVLADERLPRVSSARSLALLRMNTAVESLLTNPTLDSSKVAAAAGISLRYGNAVLATQGTSIMRLVQTRRLERCRKALEDPMQSHRTVSEIAHGWGFVDLTHFARKFRQLYGCSPSEFRKSVLIQRRLAAAS